MVRQAVRSLRGNPARSILTGLAVMLGVAFVVGAFVLGDMINKAFDDIFTEAGAGTDAVVQVIGATPDDQPLFDDDILVTIRGIDGVAAAEGSVFKDQVVILDQEREGIGGGGPPQFGANWATDPEINAFTIVDGRPPETPDEVVVNVGAAEDAGFAIGDTIEVAPTDAAREFTLVGTAEFAAEIQGATFALFETAASQSILDSEGRFNTIAVRAEDGISQDAIARRVGEVLPENLEAVTGVQSTEDQVASIQSDLSFFRNFFLGFAAVALLVASFVIFNTFLIIVAQRAKQLALLRAMGASRWQVRRLVLLEALIVGLLASIAGIVAGVLVAVGLLELFKATGNELPAAGVQLLPRTVIVALLVGVIVTLVAALVPAWRASRVSPVEAMRDSQAEDVRISTMGRILGLGLPVVGLALLAWGLWGDFGDLAPRITVLAFGALIIFVGSAFLTMLLARPIVALIGAPARRLAGVSGRLASENAVRNPARTAISAAALTIGVALVSFFAIFTTSLNASLDDTLDKRFRADFISFRADTGDTFTGALADRLEAAPEIGTVARWRFADAIRGEDAAGLVPPAPGEDLDVDTFEVVGIDAAIVEEIYDPALVDGGFAGLADDGIMVQDSEAEDRGLAVGDTLDVVFVGGDDPAANPLRTLTVVGIYEDTTWGDYFVALDTLSRDVPVEGDDIVLARAAEGVDIATADSAFKAIASDFPQVDAFNNQEFRDNQEAQLNQLLVIIYAMLVLAIIIALFGIIITLALAVFERTREIGLLRAIGMSRRQVGRMIRWESVLVAVLGGLVGVVIGTLLGWVIISRLEEFIQVLAIPWVSLAVFVALSALVGVIAAIFPARRAGKMNVLEAVATE